MYYYVAYWNTNDNRVVKTFNTQEEAKAFAKEQKQEGYSVQVKKSTIELLIKFERSKGCKIMSYNNIEKGWSNPELIDITTEIFAESTKKESFWGRMKRLLGLSE